MNSINYARIILKSLVRSYRQFYVPIPIMWRGLSTHATRIIKNDLAAEYMFRTFMVLVTCTLSRLEEYYTEDKFFCSSPFAYSFISTVSCISSLYSIFLF